MVYLLPLTLPPVIFLSAMLTQKETEAKEERQTSRTCQADKEMLVYREGWDDHRSIFNPAREEKCREKSAIVQLMACYLAGKVHRRTAYPW